MLTRTWHSPSPFQGECSEEAGDGASGLEHADDAEFALDAAGLAHGKRRVRLSSGTGGAAQRRQGEVQRGGHLWAEVGHLNAVALYLVPRLVAAGAVRQIGR